MNSNTSRENLKLPDEVPASIAQTTPRTIGYGHPEYNFVSAIMEMQKSLGEINASIQALNKTTESTKSKVDDLVNWKNMILGGAITVGFLIGSAIGLFKIFEHSFNPPSEASQSQSSSQLQPSTSKPNHRSVTALP
jgi:hypothetical protein